MSIRVILLGAFVAVSLAVAMAMPMDMQEIVAASPEWQAWKLEHGKVYGTSQEEATKFQTFLANKKIVEAHNAEADNGVHTFYLGMNQFADMTNEEYRKQMNGFKARAGAGSKAVPFNPATVSVAADSVDWRTHKPAVVNKPKNQGGCGSCWAFSAVATMEGVHALNTGDLLSFSEQELVDCVNNGADTCSQGGEMYDGVELGVTKGMESESDYEYTGSSGGGCKYSKSKVKVQFTGYSNITSGDEDALAAAVTKVPIVSVGIDASSIMFQLYRFGIYNHPLCHNKIDELDHGVAVVGFGTENGKDYWIVRNSWGAMWGEKGYIKMSRNKKNQCGIATQACFALE